MAGPAKQPGWRPCLCGGTRRRCSNAGAHRCGGRGSGVPALVTAKVTGSGRKIADVPGQQKAPRR
jgi:hypothetical protein